MKGAVLLVLFLTACESDTEKLQRLETEALIACLAADQRERVAEARYVDRDSASTRRMAEARDQRAECTLAERELDRFLR